MELHGTWQEIQTQAVCQSGSGKIKEFSGSFCTFMEVRYGMNWYGRFEDRDVDETERYVLKSRKVNLLGKPFKIAWHV